MARKLLLAEDLKKLVDIPKGSCLWAAGNLILRTWEYMILQTEKDLSLWNLLVPKHYQSVPKARKVQSFYECPDMLEDSYRYFQYNSVLQSHCIWCLFMTWYNHMYSMEFPWQNLLWSVFMMSVYLCNITIAFCCYVTCFHITPIFG